MTEVVFYRRDNGSGAIEVIVESGGTAFLPGEFTDRPGTSEEIVDALKQVVPKATFSVR